MGKQPTDSNNISKEKMAEGFKRALSNYIPVLKNTLANIKKNIPKTGLILSSFMAVILTNLIYPMTKRQRKESLSMNLSADTALNGFGKIECGLSHKLFTFVIIFK